MKKSQIEKHLIVFLGHMKKNNATEEELQTVINTIGLLRKYLPFYKAKKGS